VEINYKNMRLAKLKWPETRCCQCNRLLFHGIVEDVEIKCPRCGAVQLIGSCKPRQQVSMQNCRNLF